MQYPPPKKKIIIIHTNIQKRHVKILMGLHMKADKIVAVVLTFCVTNHKLYVIRTNLCKFGLTLQREAGENNEKHAQFSFL